jgi:hypothetical protein
MTREGEMPCFVIPGSQKDDMPSADAFDGFRCGPILCDHGVCGFCVLGWVGLNLNVAIVGVIKTGGVGNRLVLKKSGISFPHDGFLGLTDRKGISKTADIDRSLGVIVSEEPLRAFVLEGNHGIWLVIAKGVIASDTPTQTL